MIDAGFIVVALFWAFAALAMEINVRRVPQLPRRTVPVEASVTVVITARDEVERIAESVRRWLDQRGVELRIVVVDDRYSDGTADAIPDDPRVEVVRVETLPDGWLGKTHACHVGAARAGSDWLLFTDADAWAEPELVADAIAEAHARGADHFSLIPGLGYRSWPGRVTILHFLTLGTAGAGMVNGGSRRVVCGAGAFNLIRREPYLALGGHESLRLEVLDDLALAARARDAALRSYICDASHRLEVEWGGGIFGVIHAIEKNAFALTGYRWSVALLGLLFGVATWTPAVVGAFVGGVPGLLATLALGLTVVAHLRVGARRGWGLLVALVAPLASPILWAALLRSAWVTTRQGGVLWRDTLYPTAMLRAARRR